MPENRKATISVIIPTYQEGRYIGSSLSRLAKVNDPLEIIVVDGRSTDETVKVAKHFTDKIYIVNRRGIAKARNYGAYRASGEILLFLDADVSPPLNFVEKVLRTFRDREVVAATCDIMPEHPRLPELIFFLFYNTLLHFFVLFKPHSRGEFLVVRREDFLKIGGFNENLPCLEDHDFAFRVSKLGKFVFIPDLTVYESMRRFRKLGLFNVVKTWFSDYLSLILFQRTLSKTWKPVR